jgi:hypothetical protein
MRSRKEQREEERLMKAKKKRMMTRTHPVDMKALRILTHNHLDGSQRRIRWTWISTRTTRYGWSLCSL